MQQDEVLWDLSALHNDNVIDDVLRRSFPIREKCMHAPSLLMMFQKDLSNRLIVAGYKYKQLGRPSCHSHHYDFSGFGQALASQPPAWRPHVMMNRSPMQAPPWAAPESTPPERGW